MAKLWGLKAALVLADLAVLQRAVTAIARVGFEGDGADSVVRQISAVQLVIEATRAGRTDGLAGVLSARLRIATSEGPTKNRGNRTARVPRR